jgi:MFS family permease
MATTTYAHPARAATRQEAGRTLAVAAAGTFLVLFTFAAVATTVVDSARDLHASASGITWLLSGMSLGLAVALLTAGALADDLGRRRVFVLSAAGLAIAGVVGAVAPSMDVLVAARVLQGAAGAGVLAAGLGAIGSAFPSGGARTHATGVWAAAVGGGIAIGPVAGGALAAALGWRSGFWLEAAAAALLLPAAGAVAESRAPAGRSIDLAGLITLGAGMACLTAGLVEGRSSWSAPATLGLLAAGGVLVVAFGVIESRRSGPMLDLRLFGDRRFVASITGALFTGLAVIGLMSYSPTVYEQTLHIGVVGSAGVLAVWSATSMVVALAARRLPARIPSQTRLALGLALCAAGEVALTNLAAGGSWTRVVPGLAIAGVGSGLANAALGRLAVESVPHERAGMSSGANNTARYLGGAAGVALVVALGAHGGGTQAVVDGWDRAAIASAALCALGAVVALLCRVGGTRSAPR